MKFADSASLTYKGATGVPTANLELIGKKYIDMASHSIGNTILKVLGYLQEI